MNIKVLIRGGGDLATGIAYRLFKSGFKVVITELSSPLVIRRTVAFASAVYEGEFTVEGIKAKLVKELPEEFYDYIPILIDPDCKTLKKFQPQVMVDATIAKKNTGINKSMAKLVIALGPGFYAGHDVHKVIETNRGHFLGRIITDGTAEADTGIPGNIEGYSAERIIRAAAEGVFNSNKEIGHVVDKGETIGEIDGKKIEANISGTIRGLIRNGFYVKEGLKIGDIDPRCKKEYITTISDKAMALGGSVLQAIMEEGYFHE